MRQILILSDYEYRFLDLPRHKIDFVLSTMYISVLCDKFQDNPAGTIPCYN